MSRQVADLGRGQSAVDGPRVVPSQVNPGTQMVVVTGQDAAADAEAVNTISWATMSFVTGDLG